MITKETVYLILSRIAAAASAFLISILTARYLGPQGRGNFFLVVTSAAVLSQFCNLGLHSSNTYLVASKQSLMGSLTANSLWISIILGVLSSIITLGTFSWLNFKSYDSFVNLAFIVILVPATLFYMLGTNLLIGLHKTQLYNLIILTSNLFTVTLVLIGIFLHFHTTGLVAFYTGGWLISALLVVYFTVKFCNFSSLRFNSEIFKAGFLYSMKAYITTFLGLLVLKCGVFFLKYYFNDSAVGYFSIASQITDGLIIIPASIALILFPKLIKNPASRWQETKKSLISTAVLMFLLCACTFLLIKPFVILLFGKNFSPSISLLIWMLPGVFFLGIASIISQYLCANGFPKEQVFAWSITLLISIVLNILLIPKMGAIAAALVFSLTHFLLLLFLFSIALWLQKKEQIFTISSPQIKICTTQ